MKNTDECITQVWEQEQDILNVIHKICIQNDLKYSLFFGTLLGAVRHGGFIPWDDDIDLMMPRDDYEKLIEIWDDVAPAGYLIQNKRTDSDFTQNFTKIRKDNTTFIQDEFEKTVNYHTGIFVDIFPADRIAPKGYKRTGQYVASAFNLLTARGYSSGTGGIIGVIEKCVLGLPQKLQLKIYHKTEKNISKWLNNTNAKWYSPNTIDVCRRYYDADMFEKIETIEFCGCNYCTVQDVEGVLTKTYGDYMKLPPAEERVWKHHPIIVDFENNYKKRK